MESMSVTDPRATGLRDPDLPALSMLLADGIPAPVAAAVAATGSTVESAVASQVTWWPGESVTVRYRASLRGALSGEHQVVAASGSIPTGAVVVRAGEVDVGVWRLPHDPRLPGLASALDPAAARLLMADLGAGDGPVETRLRSYRPGKRAVVEISGPRARVFAKVVDPGSVRSIHRTHLALQGHLPVPQSLGMSPDLGIIVLQALPGRVLRQVLEDDRLPLPPPRQIESLLTQLPAATTTRELPSPIERLPRYLHLLGRIVPEQRERIERLSESMDHLPPATTPSHGDFHEAQVLVGAGAVSGLIDLDTFGLGRRADDPAGMLGHLAVWRLGSKQPARVAEFADSLLRGWQQSLDAADLRRRVAAVIAGLATGPFRVQRAGWPDAVSARLALADRWLDSAQRVDERHLIAASAASHRRQRH
jgi:hypothetical protein